jgi:hypothetical protein
MKAMTNRHPFGPNDGVFTACKSSRIVTVVAKSAGQLRNTQSIGPGSLLFAAGSGECRKRLTDRRLRSILCVYC